MLHTEAIARQYKALVTVQIIDDVVIIHIVHPVFVIFTPFHWITQNLICLVDVLKARSRGILLAFLLIRVPFQCKTYIVRANRIVGSIIIHFQYLVVILGFGESGEEIEIEVEVRIVVEFWGGIVVVKRFFFCFFVFPFPHHVELS
uniref:Uncharacterized protein n=1 Tax=Lotus japonicus TaxID=34305 RepID=I3S280_LOTJA|nr:unknown [Lotus japonicus]